MASKINTIKIVNNIGSVNFGDRYNLSPITLTKQYNGSGGDNLAEFLNGRFLGGFSGQQAQLAEQIEAGEEPFLPTNA